MSGPAPDLIIVGGGLSGCLAALALKARRPDVSFLLIEADGRFGGNHIWSFFDGDVAKEGRWLVDLVQPWRWADHEVRFPRRSRTLGLGYNSIRSERFDRAVREALSKDQYRLNAPIAEIRPDGVTLERGERIEGAGVIDARGVAPVEGVELAWQKFVGRTYRCDKPHGRSRPTIMDALVDQSDGYRFVYTLPFSDTDLLVEDTYYSDGPALDGPVLRRRIDEYVERAGWTPATLEAEEMGVLPVVLSGEIGSFWPRQEPLARLGLRGGFFHPTTGYSLPDAVANAALLARQQDLGSAALHRLFEDRAAALWQARGFYRMLNRMLFGAAGPRSRYTVLEHFYRLPEPVIARFYAGESTLLDKLRILSGRPPVPVGKALAAARRRAA